MNLMLWFEGEEEQEENNTDTAPKKEEEAPKCVCGRAVCCGKHKSGQCSCGKKQKERS